MIFVSEKAIPHLVQALQDGSFYFCLANYFGVVFVDLNDHHFFLQCCGILVMKSKPPSVRKHFVVLSKCVPFEYPVGCLYGRREDLLPSVLMTMKTKTASSMYACNRIFEETSLRKKLFFHILYSARGTSGCPLSGAETVFPAQHSKPPAVNQ